MDETEFGKLVIIEEFVVGNCGLALACDWGGTEERCCLDCENLPDCLNVCRIAESQLITGEKCRWREDRARNRRDLDMSDTIDLEVS